MKIFDFQQVIHHVLRLQKKKFSHCLHSVWNKKNQKFYETRIYFLYNDPQL